MNKAFFFDRDGTLVEGVYRADERLDGSPFNISELRINPNSKQLVAYVKSKGYTPIIITNQPDFLKRNLPLKDYEEITTKICSELNIERNQVFECFHRQPFSLECICRKPEPGLILMARGLYNLNLEQSWLVGDSWKDIASGKNAGIKNIIFLKRNPFLDKQAGNLKDIEKMSELNLSPKYTIEDILEIQRLLK